MPSTVIASFNYYTETRTLRVRFTSGIIYDYENVSEQVYKEMKASFSKGIYFNSHIKNKYSFQKVE
jgi:hypothetical protein